MAPMMPFVRRLFATALFVVTAGCSTAPPSRSIDDAYARHATARHYAWARSLQHLIAKQDTADLLNDTGQDMVLDLARAQNCLTSRTQDPALAARTHALLDAYLDLHEEHDAVPSASLRRKIRRAQTDAHVAGQGVASPYFLGCEPFRTPGRRGSNPTFIHRDTKGYGRRRSRARSVPGGVIR